MADGCYDAFEDDAGPIAAAPSPEELCRFDLNDYGNAMRLIRLAGGEFGERDQLRLHGAVLLYLPEHGWIGFDGQRWDLKHGEQLASRLAHKVARGLWDQARVFGELKAAAILREAEDPTDEATIKAAKRLGVRGAADFYGFAEQSGNTGKTKGMLVQAQSYLTADLADFDRDPYAMAVENGTLKWRKGDAGWTLKFSGRHDPADRITRLASVKYDPKATAPLWTAKLAEWLPEESVRRFVQRISGYGSTGSTQEQAFFIFQGLGGDGKSTYVDALRSVLGDYSATADVKTFLDTGTRSGADANPDLARLAGATRFVSTAEPPRGAKLNEAMIKSFTGGAPILARRLRKDPFEFTPNGKVFLECNSRPKITGSDEGIWRRLFIVLWEVRVAKDKIDRELPLKFRAEGSGILNWLMAGVGDWLSQGLSPPERVSLALEDYRKGSSPFGEWLAEFVVEDRNAKVLASGLYRSFKEFMEERDPDAKVMSQRSFGEALADRQILRSGKDTNGNVLRQGARLKTHDELSADRSRSAEPSAPAADPLSFEPDDDDPFDPKANGQ